VTQSADKRYKDEIKPFKRDNQTGTLFATCALGFRLCLCAQPAPNLTQPLQWQEKGACVSVRKGAYGSRRTNAPIENA
jgi:hypothetical protein